MARRRMFETLFVDADAFLDMPATSQLLYFHLSMRADDDGFIHNPKSVMRACGGTEDDMRILITKKYLISFDSGIVVVKHWNLHNKIPKDRYKPTHYQEEKATLMLDDKGAYTKCIQDVYKLDTQVRLGEVRQGEISVVEGSENVDTSSDNLSTETVDNSKLELMHGKLGKGVVLLTEAQKDSLLEILGFDAFNHYIEKLANFIISKGATVGNHYQTILKWAKEDRMLKN